MFANIASGAVGGVYPVDIRSASTAPLGPLTGLVVRQDEYLGLAASGKDPAALKQGERAALTVCELCDLYLAEGCATKKASTIATDRGRVERHIKPLLGRTRVVEVSRGDIERFLRDVADGRTKADVRTRPRGRAIVDGGRKGMPTKMVANATIAGMESTT